MIKRLFGLSVLAIALFVVTVIGALPSVAVAGVSGWSPGGAFHFSDPWDALTETRLMKPDVSDEYDLISSKTAPAPSLFRVSCGEGRQRPAMRTYIVMPDQSGGIRAIEVLGVASSPFGSSGAT